jgi:hypothetical protein
MIELSSVEQQSNLHKQPRGRKGEEETGEDVLHCLKAGEAGGACMPFEPKYGCAERLRGVGNLQRDCCSSLCVGELSSAKQQPAEMDREDEGALGTTYHLCAIV